MTSDALPIGVLAAHGAEACGVAWNPTSRDCFVSCGWDGQVHLWDADPPSEGALATPRQRAGWHAAGPAYGAAWAPTDAHTLCSAGGDGELRVWDLRSRAQTNSGKALPALCVAAHDGEALSVDYDKYSGGSVVFSGGTDAAVRAFDLRMPAEPLAEGLGHDFAVRRVKAAPFDALQCFSCSYDTSVRLWSAGRPAEASRAMPCLWSIDEHTEFSTGCDASLFRRGRFATCAWDATLRVWRASRAPP